MAQGQTVKTDPRASFTATLPLRVPPRFTSMELLMIVCDMLEGTGVTAQVEPDLSIMEAETEGSRFWSRPETPPRVGLTINGITLLIEGHDKPAFGPGDLDQFDFGKWVSGKGRLLRARAHVRIIEYNSGPTSDLDYNYDRAAAMSVAASAVDRLIGTVGLVWHTSSKVVASDEIAGMFKGLMEGSAPVGLWVSSLALPKGSQGSATRGFFGLLGAELAILSPDIASDQVSDVALELAAEILRGGEAPAHGERLHYGEGMRFKVEHRAIGVDGGVPIVVLTQQVADTDVEELEAEKPRAGEMETETADAAAETAAAEAEEVIPETAEPAPNQGEPKATGTTDSGEGEETADSDGENRRDGPGSMAAAGAA